MEWLSGNKKVNDLSSIKNIHISVSQKRLILSGLIVYTTKANLPDFDFSLRET